MAKNVYVPPRRNVKIKSGQNARITSSHQKPYRKDGKPAHERTIHPDEAQQEAATELNPAFVNPDGSINFWAGISTAPQSTHQDKDEPEDK
ncbi:MAG: hypothetical protein P1P90_01315 [Patescibacteria group bacterium]|nr:hypothetical protein [Patescibacteria group bacterium]